MVNTTLKKFNRSDLGSTLSVLLFLLVNVCSAFNALPSDTIIVDGKTVVVNRTVEYDTLETKQDPPKEIKRQHHRWGVNIEFLGGPNLNSQQGNFEDFQSINEFRGKSLTVGESFAGHGALSFHWKKSWFLKMGVGVGITSIANSYFPESQLDTALWRFDLDENNDVRQILLYVYDIGTETDTTDLKMISSNFTQMTLNIPLSFTKLFATKRKGMNISAEVGVINKIALSQAGGPFSMLKENGEYVHIAGDDLKVSSYQAQPFVGVGATINLGRNQRSITWNPEFYASLMYAPSLAPINAASDPILLKHQDINIVVGLRFFIKPKP